MNNEHFAKNFPSEEESLKRKIDDVEERIPSSSWRM